MKTSIKRILDSQILMGATIIVSALLSCLFVREGKIGSALVSLSATMGLGNIKFGLLDRAQSLENKAAGRWMVAGWFVTLSVLLGASFLLLFVGK